MNPDEPEVSSIILALKRAWSDGSKSLEFSQVNFVERLAALVPEPWINLTRYHGVLGRVMYGVTLSCRVFDC